MDARTANFDKLLRGDLPSVDPTTKKIHLCVVVAGPMGHGILTRIAASVGAPPLEAPDADPALSCVPFTMGSIRGHRVAGTLVGVPEQASPDDVFRRLMIRADVVVAAQASDDGPSPMLEAVLESLRVARPPPPLVAVAGDAVVRDWTSRIGGAAVHRASTSDLAPGPLLRDIVKFAMESLRASTATGGTATAARPWWKLW